MSSFWNGDGSQEVNVLTRVWQLNEQKMNKIEIYIYWLLRCSIFQNELLPPGRRYTASSCNVNLTSIKNNGFMSCGC